MSFSHAIIFQRRRTYAMATVLILAAGTFSVGFGALFLNRVILAHPNNITNYETLYRVSLQRTGQAPATRYLNPLEFEEWRMRLPAFKDFAASAMTGGAVKVGDQIEWRLGAIVTESYFSMIGSKAAVGRVFRARDYKANSPLVCIVSRRLWKEFFGEKVFTGAENLEIDARPYWVVGVMPADFDFPGDRDYWTPLMPDGRTLGPKMERLQIMGLLQPGVLPGAAQEQVNVVANEGAFKSESKIISTVAKFKEVANPALKNLSSASFVCALALLGVVLLNLHGLLSARRSARRSEDATKLALGASQRRVIADNLKEVAFLGIIGATIGVVLMFWADMVLRSVLPGVIVVPGWMSLKMDWQHALFAGLFTLATALIMQFLDAVRSPVNNVHRELQTSTSANFGRLGGRHLHRQLSLLVQFACTFGFAVFSLGMWARFNALSNRDIGIDPEGVFWISISPNDRSQDFRSSYYAAQQKLAAMPGVTAVGYGFTMPGQREFGPKDQVKVAQPGAQPMSCAALVRYVSPELLDVFRISTLVGRRMQNLENPDANREVMVDEEFASRYLAGESAIGLTMQLRIPGMQTDVSFIIAGVLRRTKSDIEAAEYTPTVYVPINVLRKISQMNFYVRVNKGSILIKEKMREALGESRSVVFSLRQNGDYREQILSGYQKLKLLAWTFSLSAVFVCLVSATGNFGLMLNLVEEQKRAIGIRSALGATPASITWLYMSHCLVLLLGGALAGIVVVLFMRPIIETLVGEPFPHESWTYVVSLGVVVVPAFFAGLLPVLTALRDEPYLLLKELN